MIILATSIKTPDLTLFISQNLLHNTVFKYVRSKFDENILIMEQMEYREQLEVPIST